MLTIALKNDFMKILEISIQTGTWNETVMKLSITFVVRNEIFSVTDNVLFIYLISGFLS